MCALLAREISSKAKLNIEEETEAREKSAMLTFIGIASLMIAVASFFISLLYCKKRMLSLKNRNTALLLETERVNTRKTQSENGISAEGYDLDVKDWKGKMCCRWEEL